MRTSWATVLLSVTRAFSLLLSLFVLLQSQSSWRSLNLPLSAWSSLLASIYFLLVSLASLIGIWKGTINRQRQRVSAALAQALATSAHALWEVAGSLALFTLVLESGLYPSARPFISLPGLHAQSPVPLLVLAPFVVEGCLNNLEVRFDQYPSSLAALLLYLFLLWPLVYTGRLRNWPYGLLQTASADCFALYLVLAGLHFLCFAGGYLAHKVKVQLADLVVAAAIAWRGDTTTTTSSNGEGGGGGDFESELASLYSGGTALLTPSSATATATSFSPSLSLSPSSPSSTTTSPLLHTSLATTSKSPIVSVSSAVRPVRRAAPSTPFSPSPLLMPTAASSSSSDNTTSRSNVVAVDGSEAFEEFFSFSFKDAGT